MSRSFRRAKRTYPFFSQRPIIISDGTGGIGVVDATRMRQTYATKRDRGIEFNDALRITSISPTSGTESTQTAVEIHGTGFLSVTSLTFAGTNAVTFTVTSDTLITATTPSLSRQTADIVISSPASTYTYAAGYTYNFAGPVVSATSYDVIDTGGGGRRVVLTVDSSTGVVSIAAGGSSFTGLVIDDSTHVSGVPAAHAAGVVDVVVTNGYGPSIGGTGLIEYFTPLDLSPTLALMSGSYAVVGSQGVNAVGTWTDSSGNGNHAGSVDGIHAPAELNGVPDFVAADSLYLVVSQSIATVSGSPPDLGTLGAGTEIAFFEPDQSTGAAGTAYEDSVVVVGDAASAGICYNNDGITWEAYDEGAFANYRRPTATSAAVGGKHFAAGRWSGSTWDCFVNSAAVQTVTADAAVLSNGNVGVTTEIGRSYSGNRLYDGRIHTILMYKTALGGDNIAKIRKWGQQRGIALVGNPAVVSAVSHTYVDISGGGGYVNVTVDSSVGCSAITAGGVAFTDFSVVNATTVRGIPGAHAAGQVDVVVTNLGGLSTGGTALITYWSPLQITGVTRYYDSSKSVTDAGGGAVSSWIDQTDAADAATQATGANRPTLTASVFGTMPSVRFVPEQWLDLATGEAVMAPVSLFVVMKTTSSAAAGTATDPTFNPALTIIGGSGWDGFGVDGGAIAYKSYDVALETWGSSVNDGNPHLIGMTGDLIPTRQGYKDGIAVGSASQLGGTAATYWDHIGNGRLNVDGFDGDVGAIITLALTSISGEDLAVLNQWAQQRFGTP